VAWLYFERAGYAKENKILEVGFPWRAIRSECPEFEGLRRQEVAAACVEAYYVPVEDEIERSVIGRKLLH